MLAESTKYYLEYSRDQQMALHLLFKKFGQVNFVRVLSNTMKNEIIDHNDNDEH